MTVGLKSGDMPGNPILLQNRGETMSVGQCSVKYHFSVNSDVED